MASVRAAQIAIQKKLNESFLIAKSKNPAFSLRAFARKLALSHSSLSEILTGKRAVSRKMAMRLLENLELNQGETRALLELFPAEKNSPLTSDLAHYIELSNDQFHLTADWYYFAILSLCETSDFKASAKWISRRLNISHSDAQVAIRRLLRLKLIEKDEKGKFVRREVAYSTSDDIGDIVLRRAHSKNLELANESLEKDPIFLRDFSSITMPTDPSKIPVAKKMIREFQDRLCLYLETPPKTEVYRLCVQFFPLSRRERQNVH